MLGLQLLLCIYETWFFTEDYSIGFLMYDFILRLWYEHIDAFSER
jgi:hypothetical protein